MKAHSKAIKNKLMPKQFFPKKNIYKNSINHTSYKKKTAPARSHNLNN